MRNFITVVLASLVLSLASADSVPAHEKENANADSVFLIKVIPGTAASVKIIEYAAKYASNEDVRNFAERVAKQHKAFVKTATEHAERLRIAVVADSDKDSKSMIDKLSTLKGADLDVVFLLWLSDAHEDAAVFEREVKNGNDADLRAFAKNAITSGHEHLHEAQAILARLKK